MYTSLMAEAKHAVIVGAGLGGICAGYHLLKAGISDFTILEREREPGGTWRDNSYPGCACDVPVALYQFSFAPSLKWRHLFPRAVEMKSYVDDLVTNLNLAPRFHGGDGGRSASWNDSAQRWLIRTDAGAEYETPILIVALGQLNRPKLPDIAGRDTFAGPSFHSARWDHSVSLEGKRVGIIGCAASAVQIIPEVAKIASRLTVFQRTPNWLLPRLDREITEEEMALLMTAPHVAQLTRDQIYEQADYLFWQAFQWTPVGRAAYTRASIMHLEAQVPDAELRRKLTPDYPIGAKRILFADDYYPALMRSNVTLETDVIDRITSRGVSMRGGRLHDIDVLVYATGFETTDWHWSMSVHGRGGVNLAETWKDGPEAYLGITVSGFPNLFMLYGPNTNLGHNSITFMLERQSEYIAQAITQMNRRGIRSIEPKRELQDHFNRDLQAKLAHTVWADPQCSSWYKNAAGKITQNWMSHTREYAAAVKTVNFEDFMITHPPLSPKLDPVIRQLLELIRSIGRPPLETLSISEARQLAAEGVKPVGGTPEPMRSVEEVSLGDFRVRVYTPDAFGPMPGLVYFHGGGWSICDLDTHDVPCRAIAKRAGAIVVSVDYRLAPEHKFPIAVEDALAATKWVAANAEKLGIDPLRISVGGDSAGGNLAAVVCHRIRDEGGPSIASQVLVYPGVDLSSFETNSHREFAEGHQLTRGLMEWFRDQYLRSLDDAKHPHASPLLASNFKELPPALVITAQCDPLCDEGEAYANKLRMAGVAVEYKCYAGMIHPFWSWSGAVPQAVEAFQQVADFLAGRAGSAAC
jgi:cation diffusion facilitator CzcD-associated flavoprotein CzcO/acetyl esterase/lipase